MQILFSYICVMVTIDDLKDELLITWSQDDAKLQRKLNAAVDIVERYTNRSLVSKTVTRRSNGCPIEFYGSPIESINGATRVEYTSLGAMIYAKSGDVVSIELGESYITALDESVLRIGATLYENGEISEVNLPLDVQLLLNQYRLDSFID